MNRFSDTQYFGEIGTPISTSQPILSEFVMYVSRYKSTLLLSVLFLMLAAPACQASDPIPGDGLEVMGTKQIAGRNKYPEDNLTFDFDTFNFTVVNGRKSKDGYPIFAMECNFHGDRQCYGEVGQPLGSIPEVAAEMTVVSNKDVLRPDWYCDYICVDGQNIIVGSVSPAMQAWLKRHRSAKKH